MKKVHFLSFFYLLFLWTSICSEASVNIKSNNINPEILWTKYEALKTDTARISCLKKLANYYMFVDYNEFLSDSISQLAIEIAELSHNDNLILDIYNAYLETNNIQSYGEKSGIIADKAEAIADITMDPQIIWRTYQNISNYNYANFKYNQALEYAYRAFTVAGTINNEKLKAKSYLKIGRILEGKNNKVESFKNLLNALTISEQEEDEELLISCYHAMSRFYELNKVYTKAKAYKLKEFELIKNQLPIDSNRIAYILLDFEGIEYSSNNNNVNEKNIRYILSYAERNNYENLKDEVISLYRSTLITADRFDKLYEFYVKDYPEELAKLKNTNYILYLRIKAFLCEVQNQIDSTHFYFEQTAQLIDLNPNKILVSNFYNRYGQFLERQKLNEAAILKFKNALSLSSSAGYLPFSQKAANRLEQLYKDKEDYTNAYKFAYINRALTDSMMTLAKKDELLRLEIDNEAKLRELTIERVKKQTRRRHNLQYTAIIVLILTVFVIFIVLARYNVPTWAIRAIGFFAFIFFFEFIILIADNYIHHATHGEPWKILLIKIFLIGILLPLHHYFEGKAVYLVLTNQKLKMREMFSFKDFFRKYILKEGEH